MNNYSLHFTKFQNTSEYTDDVGLIGLDLELLNSINQKLSLLDLLRKDIGEMKSDLESTQNQITLLRMDNRTIKGILSMLEIWCFENIRLKKRLAIFWLTLNHMLLVSHTEPETVGVKIKPAVSKEKLKTAKQGIKTFQLHKLVMICRHNEL